MGRTGPTPGGTLPHFPGFDVLEQADHWDDVTRATVLARLKEPPPLRFFTAGEEPTVRALLDQLLDQRSEPRVPVVEMIDQRLADGETDGWHYDDLPEDSQSWRASVRGLDQDAELAHGRRFADCDWVEQTALIAHVQDLGSESWHGMPASKLWSLWTRYAGTAFYSHPYAWNEIGFSGPAYPRGYKNATIGGREPYEVPEQHPEDPVIGS